MKLGPLLVVGATFTALFVSLMAVAGSSPTQSLTYLLAAIG